MIDTRLVSLPHGVSLSCRTAGQTGRPVLMFLHGFPEGAFVWDTLLTHFSKPENGAYFCIAPNLRGFEKSSAPPEVDAYRPKHLMQDIAALVATVCDEESGGSLPASRGRGTGFAGPQAQRPSSLCKGQRTAEGTRSDERGGHLACLVAHDWGGAIAWNLAAAMPQLMKKLAIINSPHPGTFLRELQHSPAQQAASAYMNFLIRPDAEALLAKDDFRRLWQFLTNGSDHPPAWLTDSVRDQYREVWRAGLTGGCNLYRASPLRPPRPGPPYNDPAAAAVTLARERLMVLLPTLVIWALDDIALPPALIDGLADYVPDMQLQQVAGASHWIVHEQPERVAGYLQDFLGHAR
ncbi:MAG: alpha/beta fold hydrolase [Polaromonas sp.]|uniref:alpha/beta fold hydrolase n=1 Tax=Polaromonas sp. TaxID=1869339 RepID=UPI00272F4BA6|nr:alpha/beta fold hydrolase [Polaromonas sp.]MDP2449249.1 alpha/beta fold hydrolase [Polaromonas sp.]MDP3246862.1 alpha/beta fold hydrolase [Polaromonas sp.]MDP3757564.1 alpha/beta fold hydrolase [Polaromonas sp.]